MNSGYRWLKVNEFVQVYMRISLVHTASDCAPFGEILGYVQGYTPDEKYRALMHTPAGVEEMPIPHNDLEKVKEDIESYFLKIWSSKDFQRLNISEIEEGLRSTDPVIH